MDYIHHASIPATKSELDLFHVPPTQTAIESYYEVEYRPTSTLDNAKTFDINIPASDDFTDLSETMIQVKINIKTKDNKDIDVNKVNIANGYSAALFEQVDFYLNGINIGQSNNLYGYQAFIERILYGSPSKITVADAWDEVEKRKERIKKTFDLYFRLHILICNQDKLLINGVPIQIKFTRYPNEFGLLKVDPNLNYKVQISDLSVTMKRVKLFPDVSLGIQEGLDKIPAKYFITRNEMKDFIIPQGQSSTNFESVFNGVLPLRLIIGFVKDDTFSGRDNEGAFSFKNFKITSLAASVNGSLVPSIAYSPDFDNDLYMREFVSLYRYINQHMGLPMCKINYQDYKNSHCLFAFDLSPDSLLGVRQELLVS